ncbi:hypothetical protein GMI68_01700 [Eggerthellaceae bacterium zg-886]|uniref:ParB-like N-terminal domain-containing protein n=2 Tax=Xiamenia xianingshaonis TaxID=2682776 RepID=A0ABX0IFJ6_9ACTN|nr:hypothetical protein [Xiamenia xianingshaonis]
MRQRASPRWRIECLPTKSRTTMSSKRNLRAAIKKNGGVAALVETDRFTQMSDEDIRLAAFESRRNQEADITAKMANDNRRNTMLRQAGFDYFDIDELHPHPRNHFTVDDESVLNLAGLIYKSKEVQPLVIRETRDGLEIIDGERRWRAHKLLAERYGDSWRMVPAHCHPLDSLTEQEVEFILNSNNLGQRVMTPSERAEGFRVLADALVEWRKDDPKLKGVKTKEYLAEHFGVSARTAMTNLAIARRLSKRGKTLLDDGVITREQAESMSRLTEEQQEKAADILEKSLVPKSEIKDFIAALVKGEDPAPFIHDPKKPARAKRTVKTPVSRDDYLLRARNALVKATQCPESTNAELLEEIKLLIKEL